MNRLLEQARSWREPLRYCLLAWLAGACLPFGARSFRLVAQVEAAEREPADAPLPEIAPAMLLRQMNKATLAYKTCHLEAVFVDHTNVNAYLAGKPAPEFVDVPGRFRYVTDGKRWRAEFDSAMINRTRTRLQTGSYSFEITAEGFEKEMAENVLTGSTELKFTMRRSVK